MPAGLKETLTEACNAEVAADRAIEVSVLPRDEAHAIPTLLRTATDLLPKNLEVVLLVDIVGFGLQADAGTHVASTKQIVRIEVVKIEVKGRGFRRVRLRAQD